MRLNVSQFLLHSLIHHVTLRPGCFGGFGNDPLIKGEMDPLLIENIIILIDPEPGNIDQFAELRHTISPFCLQQTLKELMHRNVFGF